MLKALFVDSFKEWCEKEESITEGIVLGLIYVGLLILDRDKN
jgi:hypothetical protein